MQDAMLTGVEANKNINPYSKNGIKPQKETYQEYVLEYHKTLLEKIRKYNDLHLEVQTISLMKANFNIRLKWNDERYRELIEEYKLLLKNELVDAVNIPLIQKALDIATYYHRDQLRKTGEPFISHPIEVTKRSMDYSFNTNVIIASLLHDAVEDTDLTYYVIESEFGSRIKEMVYRLTRIRNGTKISIEQIITEALNANDREVLLIKIIDRMHNMETIEGISEEKRSKMAEEGLKLLTDACIFLENMSLESLLVSSLNRNFNRCSSTMHFGKMHDRYNIINCISKDFYQELDYPNLLTSEND